MPPCAALHCRELAQGEGGVGGRRNGDGGRSRPAGELPPFPPLHCRQATFTSPRLCLELPASPWDGSTGACSAPHDGLLPWRGRGPDAWGPAKPLKAFWETEQCTSRACLQAQRRHQPRKGASFTLGPRTARPSSAGGPARSGTAPEPSGGTGAAAAAGRQPAGPAAASVEEALARLGSRTYHSIASLLQPAPSASPLAAQHSDTGDGAQAAPASPLPGLSEQQGSAGGGGAGDGGRITATAMPSSHRRSSKSVSFSEAAGSAVSGSPGARPASSSRGLSPGAGRSVAGRLASIAEAAAPDPAAARGPALAMPLPGLGGGRGSAEDGASVAALLALPPGLAPGLTLSDCTLARVASASTLAGQGSGARGSARPASGGPSTAAAAPAGASSPADAAAPGHTAGTETPRPLSQRGLPLFTAAAPGKPAPHYMQPLRRGTGAASPAAAARSAGGLLLDSREAGTGREGSGTGEGPGGWRTGAANMEAIATRYRLRTPAPPGSAEAAAGAAAPGGAASPGRGSRGSRASTAATAAALGPEGPPRAAGGEPRPEGAGPAVRAYLLEQLWAPVGHTVRRRAAAMEQVGGGGRDLHACGWSDILLQEPLPHRCLQHLFLVF